MSSSFGGSRVGKTLFRKIIQAWDGTLGFKRKQISSWSSSSSVKKSKAAYVRAQVCPCHTCFPACSHPKPFSIVLWAAENCCYIIPSLHEFCFLWGKADGAVNLGERLNVNLCHVEDTQYTLQIDGLHGSSGLVMLPPGCMSESTRVYFWKI